MRARALYNVGHVLEAQKEPEECLKLYLQAEKICRENQLYEDLHRTYLSLGAFYERRGDFKQALLNFDKAAQVTGINTSDVHFCINTKGELLLKFGEWAEAKKLFLSLYKNKKLSKQLSPVVESNLKIGKLQFLIFKPDYCFRGT